MFENQLEEPLKLYFGYNEFRPHQKEIISACLEGRDVLAILPTGAGKSICYQLPAILKPGIAVVVSPLISLMQDQVVGLSKNGFPAAFLNSSLPPVEMQDVLNRLHEFKLLYVAPERFANADFLQRLTQLSVSLFAIDEAHCISQWGHSFRPDYRQMALLKEKFPTASIMALTATATKEVQDDIAAQLAMKNPHVIRASFDRPNLTFRIQPKTSGTEQLLSFLAKHSNQSGIIYGPTRNEVDETYLLLQQKGLRVGRYHAGLSDAERAQGQHDFIHGECPLMVATVAFGMGIHKPDIRFVIHLDMPRSIEQYYQEVGRAGRDGLPSQCLMLYSDEVLRIYNLFLEQVTDETVKKMTKSKTEKLRRLCLSSTCRRKELLRYFGESYEPTSCDGCDVCLDDSEQIDGTVAAQKILSCVYRFEQPYGIKQVVDVLRGLKTKSVMERRHDQLSTFNLMPEASEEELRSLISALIEKGFLERTVGEYPVLRWTSTTRSLIKAEVPFLIRKKEEKQRKKSRHLEYDEVLFETLAQFRKKTAQEERVPAFVVFADKVLIEICQLFPQTRQELLLINGISVGKWQKYGQPLLDIVVPYCKRHNIASKVLFSTKSPTRK